MEDSQKKTELIKKLYEAVFRVKKTKNKDKLKTFEKSVKKMEADLEREKKREKEIDVRIIEIISKINRTRAS